MTREEITKTMDILTKVDVVLNDIKCALTSDDTTEEYERGANDVWELLKKIILPVSESGLSQSEVDDIYDTISTSDVLRRNTALEALKKFKEYEERNKLKRGDAVEIWYGEKRSNDPYGIFYAEDENDYIVLIKHKETPQNLPKFDYILKKTGEHVDLFDGLKDKE